ncbi:hypothetical protein SHL15_9281 [Streptomyces hygroscopicus subsp. limoneus]|nr:hypothetical protein SHL15_9281 [Streptomyces hygroscopicus subsp. limoneus]
MKQRTDMFRHFETQLPPDDFLLFAAAPRIGTHDDHYGMPKWPACVEAAMRRLRGEDEAFLHDWGDLMTRIGPPPVAVTADLDTAGNRLLESPWELGAETLGWFAWNPILQPPDATP